MSTGKEAVVIFPESFTKNGAGFKQNIIQIK